MNRHLFAVGRLGLWPVVDPDATPLLDAARARPVTAPCTYGDHAGPLVDMGKFEEFGGIQSGMATCSHCWSTVSRSQLRESA